MPDFKLKRRTAFPARSIELDVLSQCGWCRFGAAMAAIIAENGLVAIAVHNASDNVCEPAEAYTPERYAELQYQRPRHPARAARRAHWRPRFELNA
ncbi:MAG: hypothetical protein ACREDD_02430 [Methylocella sp.]